MSLSSSTGCVSVRTRSALPTSLICGHVMTPSMLGMHCSDVIAATESVIEVELTGCGQLVVCIGHYGDSHDVSWAESMRTARDHHEQNVEAVQDSTNGDVILRTTRPIGCGEELLVWYDLSLSRECNVPILTPINIRGDHYICVHCDSTFQYPNPLKSHMQFHCPMTLSGLATRQRSTPSVVSSTSPPSSSSSPHTPSSGGATWDYHHPALHPFGIMSPIFSRSTTSLPLPCHPWNAFLHPSLGMLSAALSGYYSSQQVHDGRQAQVSNVFCNAIARQFDSSASDHRLSGSSSDRHSALPVPPPSSTSCTSSPQSANDSHSASNYFRHLFALQVSAMRAVASHTRNNSYDGDQLRGDIGKPFDDDVGDHLTTVDDYDLEVSELSSNSSSSMRHAPEDLSTRSSVTSSLSGQYLSPIASLEVFSSNFRRHRGPGKTTSVGRYGKKDIQELEELMSLKSVPPRQIDSVTSSLSSVANGNEAAVEAFDDDIKSSMAAPGGGYKCSYCGKLYSRKYGLKIHVRTHTGFKPLQCRVCRRPFGDPSNLNKHVRLHAVHLQASATSVASMTQSSKLSYSGSSGIALMRAAASSSPYACKHCGKVLVRRRDLERHIRSRHPGHNQHDHVMEQNTEIIQVIDDGRPTTVTSSEYLSEGEMGGMDLQVPLVNIV